jgi:ABC-type Zn uptake system ZnuABC Zn-binding protein ZnuA
VLSNRYWVFHWFWVFILVSPVLISLFKLKTTKLTNALKVLVSIYIVISIINVAVDSKKKNIEIDAGEYLRNFSLDNSQSIKLINAERVGYYGGMLIPELISATQPELQNTQVIIFNGRQDALVKILGTSYQLDKSFIKNQQGVYFLKRTTSD